MKTQIQLIVATAFLTVLVWVYADLASQETRDIELTLRLNVPTGSDLVVRMEGSLPETPDKMQVAVKLGGAKAAIGKLEIEEGRGGLTLKLPMPATGTRSDEIKVRDEVQKWASGRGLHVLGLSREFIRYTVDRFVEVEITLEADPGVFANELKGPPRVEPAKVKARLLASQRDERASAERRLVLPIEEQLRNRSSDSFEEQLARQKWQGLDVTFVPDQVTISVTRRQGFETYRLTAIPLCELWPSYRPEGEYRVEWADEDDQVQHIEVIVPAGKPRVLTNKDVIAFVSIEREDLAPEPKTITETAPAVSREGIPREVHFVFPPGFEDVRVVPPLPKVRFRVVKVATPPQSK
ncbi:MAG TPA: hypothetical protein PKY77_19165 [Phycisphaerae bacterium]|nr:hypothetical protein [Phycisphaerae bacterium]HRY69355.1 hypothetical protein [Phycisphaerae bacterium]HSA26222.1 hypothetical protein [Phycisphaerae bacterium]